MKCSKEDLGKITVFLRHKGKEYAGCTTLPKGLSIDNVFKRFDQMANMTARTLLERKGDTLGEQDK